jgi:putative oxidoreductase
MTTTNAPAYSGVQSGPAAAAGRLFNLLGRFPLALVLLFLRIGIGGTFFKSGLNKIQSWDSAVSLFAEEYKVPLLSPELAAYLATAAELACPVMLVLGLLARLGAAALLGMTFVIQFFVYPENWVEHLLWAAALLYILTRGPGALSLDALIARRVYR